MIKKIVSLVSFCFIFGGMHAQQKFKPEWNVGVGAGPSFSSISFLQPNVSTKNYTSFNGGIAVRYITEKNVGIIGELNYLQAGWKGEFKDHPEYAHSHSLTYIELPVMTHLTFGSEKVRFILNIGPKVQYLIGEKEEINSQLANDIGNGINFNETNTLQYYREVENKFDYGIIAGAGLELRTKVGSFSLEGRYYFGLGDIYDNHKSAENFTRSANRTISARLTYYVKLF